MEKHRCKLCHRNFANGRALGGHMRSHAMMAAMDEEDTDHLLSSEEIESAPSSSSDEEEKGLFSHRRNFKKRHRGGDGGEGRTTVESNSDQFCSAVVQDRESETESSRNPIRRRTRKTCSISDKNQSTIVNNHPQESVSSISDTIPEEDVAHCLMMLSRDKWHREESKTPEKEEEEEEDQETEDEEEEAEEKQGSKKRKYYYHEDFDEVKVGKGNRNGRGKYRCETCNKVFRSYQALGGHRASHKRMVKLHGNGSTEKLQSGNNLAMVVVEEKIHQCPVCLRVFASGQALGGHKRSHVMGASATAVHCTVPVPVPVPVLSPPKKSISRFGEALIDLNLPAPADDDDDDDVSQIELSVVSDADFVNPFKN